MDKIERLIKQYLGQNLPKTEKTAHCLDEQALVDYFQHKLGQEDCQNIESHLAACGFCLSQLNLIFEAPDVHKQGKSAEVPEEFIQKAKALLKNDKSIGGSKMNRKRRIKKNLFLLGAIVFFVISFLIPKYFFQFLVATLILGIRWAFESEGGRTLIMVLDSWRRHSHDQDDEISHHLSNRSKSFHP
ncbi:MAG: hypothetical protein NG712_01265 [Omnitrophica bacterium]|nr:hypothetical protein [Candidatus Omnitrophota bacterium]